MELFEPCSGFSRFSFAHNAPLRVTPAYRIPAHIARRIKRPLDRIRARDTLTHAHTTHTHTTTQTTPHEPHTTTQGRALFIRAHAGIYYIRAPPLSPH